MSCYRPNVMVWQGEYFPSGSKKYKLIKRQAALISEYDQFSLDGEALSVPCRKCVGCRLDYARNWADRMLLELDHFNGKALFATLTYNNDHVPVSMLDSHDNVQSYTLCKEDVQKFMKRLRKRFSDRKIRFFLSGEYGKKMHRPHYHAILFGLSLDDFSDLRRVGNNDLGQQYYSSALFESIWQNGFIVLSDVSYKTMAYCARYTLKKHYGASGRGYYASTNSIPEFSLMSRKPGIGGFFFADHPDALDFTNVSLYNDDEVKQIPVPKFVFEKLAFSDPERYAELKQTRKELARDRILLELSQTDLSFLDYFANKENQFYKRTVAVLPRKLDESE